MLTLPPAQTGSSPALTMLDPRKPVHAEPRAEQAVLVPGDVEVLGRVFRMRATLATTRVVFDYSDAYTPLTSRQIRIVRGFLHESLPNVVEQKRLV